MENKNDKLMADALDSIDVPPEIARIICNTPSLKFDDLKNIITDAILRNSASSGKWAPFMSVRQKKQLMGCKIGRVLNKAFNVARNQRKAQIAAAREREEQADDDDDVDVNDESEEVLEVVEEAAGCSVEIGDPAAALIGDVEVITIVEEDDEEIQEEVFELMRHVAVIRQIQDAVAQEQLGEAAPILPEEPTHIILEEVEEEVIYEPVEESIVLYNPMDNAGIGDGFLVEDVTEYVEAGVYGHMEQEEFYEEVEVEDCTGQIVEVLDYDPEEDVELNERIQDVEICEIEQGGEYDLLLDFDSDFESDAEYYYENVGADENASSD